jgi:hypothetical protein
LPIRICSVCLLFDKRIGLRAVCREGRGIGKVWPNLVGYINLLLTKA